MEPYAIYAIYVLAIATTLGLNFLAKRWLKEKWNSRLGFKIPAMFLGLFVLVFGAPLHAFSDFITAYYPAGRLILENPYGLYNLKVVFVNIPILAFLFTPFSFLRRRFAFLLLAIVTCVIAFGIYYLSVRLVKACGWRRTALFCLFSINGPFLYGLKEGNSTHITLLLVLVGLLCLYGKREILTGVALGVATLIKPPLLLLAAYFMLRSKWKVAIGFVASAAAIVLASLLMFGIDLHLAWFHFCISPYAGKVMPAFNNQSLDAFLGRLLTDTSLTRWWPPLDMTWEFKILRYALLSLLIGGVLWTLWQAKQPVTQEAENLEISIVLCLLVLISPISWTHYYTYILIPLTFYLGGQLAIPQGWLWQGLSGFSLFLISLPVIHLDTDVPILRFLISHYFLGCLLLLATLLLARWETSKQPALRYSAAGLTATRTSSNQSS